PYLIRFHCFVAPRTTANEALELPLNVALEPHCTCSAVRATHKWALICIVPANRNFRPGNEVSGKYVGSGVWHIGIKCGNDQLSPAMANECGRKLIVAALYADVPYA